MFPDLDYARLKRSFEYFVEHNASADLTKPGLDPAGEASDTIAKYRAVADAIANFVDGTQDFCHERIAEIDRDLHQGDAYTLSFLHERFTKSS